MAQMMAPPELPPRVALADGDGIRRVHLRLWQLTFSTITILATAWCFRLGWVPGLLAVMVAKHILVAILVWGLGVDEPREAPTY